MNDLDRDEGLHVPWYKRPIGREIVVVFAFKIIALAVLYFVFFGPDNRVRVDPEVGPPFLGTTSVVTEGRGGNA